ncbi:MAG: DUF4331 family protein [Chthoniobacteraceae bacterium]
MKLPNSLACSFIAVALAVTTLLSTASLFAGDHGDAPALAQDPGADIGDVFLFLDPTDNTQTVLIATVHGFLVPGEILNFGSFDENVVFRFEIYNDHVNFISPVLDPNATPAQVGKFTKTVKANRTIDVTFSKRNVGLAPQTGTGGQLIPANLRRTTRQAATLTFTGFSDLNAKVFKTDINGDSLLVTPFNVSFTSPAPAFDVRNIKIAPSLTVQFFAGEVDDPFFFDLPAFTSFTDGVRNGTGPNVTAFARQRDTFAGYNTLAIALRIPTVLLLSDKGPFVGLNFLTQRHAMQALTNDGVKGGGVFKTVDRMGNPLVNEFFLPFDKRNNYNSGTPRGDMLRQFEPIITETLKEMGVMTTPPEPSYAALANMFITYGDLLVLDTTISNFGSPAGAGFDHKDGSGFASPNGRRLQDDTVDIMLTTINHNSALGDGVANSGSLTTSFPFLGKPNQPLASGSTDPTQN